MKENIIMEKRLVYLDIFRAFGIILMVMGHIGFGSVFDKLIHAFHMPMFFFISGFLYVRKEVKITELVKKKARSLLLPYAFFGFFHFMIVYAMTLSMKPLYHLLTINTEGLPIAGALWFLTALFWSDIIYFFLDQKNLKVLIVPLILIGSFAKSIFLYELPWALSASFVGLGLYWLGNETRKREDSQKKILNLPVPLCIVGSILTVFLVLMNGYINMRAGMYANIFLFWLCATLCIFIGISISKIVENKTKKYLRVQKWLISVGQNSIVYVCLNQIVIVIITKVLDGVAVGINVYVIKVATLIFSLLCLELCSYILTHTKLKILIGK